MEEAEEGVGRGTQPGRYPAFQRIARIDGRADDLFAYDDLTVHPYTFRSVLSRYPAITDYQVQQTAHGASVAVVAPRLDGAALDPTALAVDLSQSLARAGLRDPQVDVSVAESLPRTAVGKRRLFIPL